MKIIALNIFKFVLWVLAIVGVLVLCKLAGFTDYGLKSSFSVGRRGKGPTVRAVRVGNTTVKVYRRKAGSYKGKHYELVHGCLSTGGQRVLKNFRRWRQP